MEITENDLKILDKIIKEYTEQQINYKEKYMKLKAILLIVEGILMSMLWAGIFVYCIVK